MGGGGGHVRHGATPNDTVQDGNVPGKTVSGHSSARGWIHFGLGILEFVPIPLVAGAAGAVDAGMYVQEGDYGDAAAAGLSVVPGEKFFAVVGKTFKFFKDAREAKAAAKEAEELSKAEKEAKDGESVAKKKEEEEKGCPGCSIAPVVLHSGVKILHHDDFKLPGLLPIALTHCYVSNMEFAGPLGRNRISPMDACLTKQDDATWLYRMGTDRTVVFDRPAPNPGVTSQGRGFPNLFLSAGRHGGFHLKDDDLLKHFVKFKDGICRLAEIRDLNDNIITFHREPDGVLTRIERSDGFAFLFENDAQGRRIATTLRAPGGETRLVTRYTYDARDNLIDAGNSYARSRRYEYDVANRLLAYDDGVNERCEYDYDAVGRVCAVRTPGGRFDHTFAYEPDQRATTLAYTARPDAATRYTFDENGMTLTETNGLGHVRRYERNAKGTMLAAIDAEGNRTAYSYDAFGNTRTVTDPEGRRTTYHYNADGRLERLIDAAGNVWAWEHDTRGNRVATRDALGYRTDISNDAAGQPTAFMRHDGLIEQRVYDAQHNLVRRVDFRGGVTRFERDGFGRVVATTDPLGYVTRFAYAEMVGTDFWTPTALVRPDGVVLTFEFEPERATITTLDGEGGRTTRHYGPFGLLEQIEDPKGGKVRFYYDHELRLGSIVNQLGRRWTFERDAAGRVIREADFDGQPIEYSYDRASRLIERLYVDKSRVVFEYDRSGLLANLEAWGPKAQNPDVTRYWYDRRALLAGAENSVARVAIERDGNGRMLIEASGGQKIESTYDCCGNRTERRIGDHLVASSYDPMGGVRQIAIGEHPPILFMRDTLGREVRRENQQGFQLDQTWDSIGQLLSQKIVPPRVPPNSAISPGFDATVVDRSYAWSPTSALSAIRDVRWGETVFTYDANGQVTEARHGDGNIERFAYDNALQIVGAGSERDGFGAWTVGPGGLVMAGRTAHGEVVTLVRDARHRVVERRVERAGFRPKTWRYSWDERDRLARCETPAGDRWRYNYDPFGRRLSKMRMLTPQEQAWTRIRHPHLVPQDKSALDVWPERPPDTDVGDMKPPVIGIRYTWDGDVIAEEAPLRLDGAADRHFAKRWHYEPGTFVPVATETADGRMLHIINDHLGTPREMVDAAGQLTWSAEQRLWGGLRRLWTADNDNDKVKSSQSRGATWGALALSEEPQAIQAKAACPIRFQGQREDDETGLVYNRFRYYDPLVGAYVVPDPIGADGGLRSHAYVWAPTIQADAIGLVPVTYTLNGSRLCIVDKFPGGSPESSELNDFVGQWNGKIAENGGSMTTRQLTDAEENLSKNWKAKQRRENPECCKNKVAGHVPDAAAGGKTVPDAVMWQSKAVNGYVGGIVGSLPVGTTYTGVYTASSLAGC